MLVSDSQSASEDGTCGMLNSYSNNVLCYIRLWYVGRIGK